MSKECPSCHEIVEAIYQCPECERMFCRECGWNLLGGMAPPKCPDCAGVLSGLGEQVSHDDPPLDENSMDGESSYSAGDSDAAAASGGDWGHGLIVLAVVGVLYFAFGQGLSPKSNHGGSELPPSYGPGLPDVKTKALRVSRPRYGPGPQFEAVGFELAAGDSVSVDTVKNGWCLINSAEFMWADCAALAPPSGGWRDVPGPIPPRGD